MNSSLRNNDSSIAVQQGINCDSTHTILNGNAEGNDHQFTSNNLPERASTLQNRNCNKTKKKEKVINNENLTIEFLKRELAAAQARITVLDTQIDDKDKRIKILQTKVDFTKDTRNLTNPSVHHKFP